MRDPRSHSRYRVARRQYLTAYGGGPTPCALCGLAVDTTAPTHINGRRNPDAPTIEHGVPVRELRRMAATWADLVALTADVSTWAGVAHRRCQDAQGAHAVNGTNMPSINLLGEASRAW